MSDKNDWATAFEWKAVALLGIGFGLVGLDRWIISPLWPEIYPELGLEPSAIGTLAGQMIGATGGGGSWLEVLRSRNIVVGMAALLCVMACVFVLSALVPVYLTDVLALTPAQMGVVTSAIGIVVGTGEIFGGGIAPAIADSVARSYGLPSVLYVALTGAVLGIFVCVFLCETAPGKVADTAA